MVRLTREQVREIDRRAIEEYHIPGIVLMENAARAVAEAAAEMISNRWTDTLVLVACGGGNNGGDGLAVARHLHNRGAKILIFLTADPAKYTGDAKINWEIVNAMNLQIIRESVDRLSGHLTGTAIEHDLVIDAVYGTGLRGAPRPPFEDLVHLIGDLELPVLAVDIPSGLDCDSGRPLGACIRAAKTVTFVAEKAGFANPKSKQYTGDINVADIGCPRELVEAVTHVHPA